MPGEITSAAAMVELAEAFGFLPFFAQEIPGFSVEEFCPRELWFAADVDGPWEWKGPAARSGKVVYGKFFGKRAGFVSLDWFPDFANFRRDGYDFDARFDDGLAPYKDKELYDRVAEDGPLLSKRLKQLCNYKKGGNKGFDTVITRLQMQTYLCISDFEYEKDRYGRPYGWGVARYATPEALFGYDRVTAAYCREPAASAARIAAHLKKMLPAASMTQIDRLLK